MRAIGRPPLFLSAALSGGMSTELQYSGRDGSDHEECNRDRQDRDHRVDQESRSQRTFRLTQKEEPFEQEENEDFCGKKKKSMAHGSSRLHPYRTEPTGFLYANAGDAAVDALKIEQVFQDYTLALPRTGNRFDKLSQKQHSRTAGYV